VLRLEHEAAIFVELPAVIVRIPWLGAQRRDGALERAIALGKGASARDRGHRRGPDARLERGQPDRERHRAGDAGAAEGERVTWYPGEGT
jgi:hypothetical protein